MKSIAKYSDPHASLHNVYTMFAQDRRLRLKTGIEGSNSLHAAY